MENKKQRIRWVKCNYLTFTVWLDSFNNGLFNFSLTSECRLPENRHDSLRERIFNDIFRETANLDRRRQQIALDVVKRKRVVFTSACLHTRGRGIWRIELAPERLFTISVWSGGQFYLNKENFKKAQLFDCTDTGVRFLLASSQF